MELNLVSSRGLLILFILNIILLTNNDAKPVLNPEPTLNTNQNERKREEKILLPQSRAVSSQKPVIQMFGNRQQSKLSSDLTAQPESNKQVMISPRSGLKNKHYKGQARIGGINEETVEEWTVSVPRFKQNAMGNWVYNPWGVTFGKVWEDTRFNVDPQKIPRIWVDKDPPQNYYPPKIPQETVCVGKSTVYNKPRILSWLRHHMYRWRRRVETDIFMKNLRRSMNEKGSPEACHNTNYTVFREYQECTMRRHQRMESLIPNYPRHQRPYQYYPS